MGRSGPTGRSLQHTAGLVPVHESCPSFWKTGGGVPQQTWWTSKKKVNAVQFLEKDPVRFQKIAGSLSLQ